jgi:hypothetical protein
VVLAWSLVAAPAAAHDPPRVFDALLGSDGLPDVVLMNRGMLFADGDAGAYGFMCNEALGINTAERPHFARGPGAALSVVTTAGLLQSSDRGCTWTPHPTFTGLALRGFATRPTEPDTWYVTTAVNEFDNGVFVSLDAGQTWNRHYTNPAGSVFEHLFVAPSDGQRLYASGLRVGNAAFIHSISRSEDGGASFETFDFALGPDEFEVRLLGVHPSNPAVVYAVADTETGAEPLDRFLISSDGGESFSSPTAVHALGAFAITPDGNTLWLGGKAGVFRSDDAGATFHVVGDATFVSSLWLDAEGLYVGGHFPPNHQGLGLSTDRGQSVALVMDFNEASHPIACDAPSSVPATCEPLWTDWMYEQQQRLPVADAGTNDRDAGALPAPDGGTITPDAGNDASDDASDDDSGCRVGAGHADGRTLGAWILLALALARRRLR